MQTGLSEYSKTVPDDSALRIAASVSRTIHSASDGLLDLKIGEAGGSTEPGK
jgi:hypothetical protein